MLSITGMRTECNLLTLIKLIVWLTRSILTYQQLVRRPQASLYPCGCRTYIYFSILIDIIRARNIYLPILDNL